MGYIGRILRHGLYTMDINTIQYSRVIQEGLYIMDYGSDTMVIYWVKQYGL